MSLSNAEIELVVEEIAQIAQRAVVQRVFEADGHTRILQLREPGETHHLLLSTAPGSTRVHFTATRGPQPATPSAFTMQLRRWLKGALFERVRQVGDDRIIRLDFRAVDQYWLDEQAADNSAKDERDTPAPRVWVSLLVELTGRHPNWYLLDKDEQIMGQLAPRSVGERELGVGRRWSSPQAPAATSRARRVRWELDALAPESFRRSEVIAEFYAEQIRSEALEQQLKSLNSRLKRRRKKLKRRARHIEGDLQRVESAEEFRRRGELLQSAWGKVERGAEKARVPDFYDPALPEVEIPLKPAMSLQENIEHYFHEYQRLRAAQDQIEGRLLETLELVERVDKYLQEVAQFEGQAALLGGAAGAEELVDELKALGQKLQDEGVLKAARAKRDKRKRRAARRRPYREFKSYHGATILVGRGAADNDTLSISIARGRDYWFHARDWAGSHVILRMNKRDDAPKKEDLLDAATLAGWFSRGKNDTLIDISYTRAKFIRKPKGFPPGRVTVSDASTLGLSIEDARLKRLFEAEVRA